MSDDGAISGRKGRVRIVAAVVTVGTQRGSALGHTVRWLRDRVPPFEWLLGTGVAQRFITTMLLQALLADRARFVLDELARRSRLSTYRLRGSTSCVVLRTGGTDAWVMGEIFRDRAYEFPSEVSALLDDM